MERFVPNIYTFRTALRLVKCWAKCRNICSYKLGFLHDFSLSILVARVCQLHPNSSPVDTVVHFFTIYSKWEWSNPIMLNVPEEEFDLVAGNHMENNNMKILSPMIPHKNTANTVTQSTLQVIVKEFKRGHEITTTISENKASWKELFKTDNFFTKYRHYIVITASAATKADQQEWASFVETKLRHLVCQLERNSGISLAHPYVNSFPKKHGLTTKWIIGFAVSQSCPKHLDLNAENKHFQNLVTRRSQGVYKVGMLILVEYSTRKTLKEFIPIQNVSVRTKELRTDEACSKDPNSGPTAMTKTPPVPAPETTQNLTPAPAELSDDDPVPVKNMTGKNIELKLLNRK